MGETVASRLEIAWETPISGVREVFKATCHGSRLSIWRNADGSYELTINGVRRAEAGRLENVKLAAQEFMSRKILGVLTPEERLEEANHLLRRALGRIVHFGPNDEPVANLIRLYFGERPV